MSFWLAWVLEIKCKKTCLIDINKSHLHIFNNVLIFTGSIHWNSNICLIFSCTKRTSFSEGSKYFFPAPMKSNFVCIQLIFSSVVKQMFFTCLAVTLEYWISVQALVPIYTNWKCIISLQNTILELWLASFYSRDFLIITGLFIISLRFL